MVKKIFDEKWFINDPDLILMDENPLKNLKYLYATGDIKLDEENDVVRVGGVEKHREGKRSRESTVKERE